MLSRLPSMTTTRTPPTAVLICTLAQISPRFPMHRITNPDPVPRDPSAPGTRRNHKRFIPILIRPTTSNHRESLSPISDPRNSASRIDCERSQIHLCKIGPYGNERIRVTAAAGPKKKRAGGVRDQLSGRNAQVSGPSDGGCSIRIRKSRSLRTITPLYRVVTIFYSSRGTIRACGFGIDPRAFVEGPGFRVTLCKSTDVSGSRNCSWTVSLGDK
jgi:hypothetical protein